MDTPQRMEPARFPTAADRVRYLIGMSLGLVVSAMAGYRANASGGSENGSSVNRQTSSMSRLRVASRDAGVGTDRGG